MLMGSEVKSLRRGKATIAESYAQAKDGEIFLVNAYIPEYTRPTASTTSRRRTRKLLVHKREAAKLAAATQREGMTLVPLRVYFTPKGIAKIELGIAKGKKLHDKRETEKKRDWARDKARLHARKGMSTTTTSSRRRASRKADPLKGEMGGGGQAAHRPARSGPCEPPAAGPAPGQQLAGARSRRAAASEAGELAAADRRAGREPDRLVRSTNSWRCRRRISSATSIASPNGAATTIIGRAFPPPRCSISCKPKPEARHVLFHAYDGYTTNVKLSVFAEPNVLLAHAWEGKPMPREHGGPVRVVIPDWYFWKSPKWVTRHRLRAEDQPGFWETRGYHNEGDPWKEERYS